MVKSRTVGESCNKVDVSLQYEGPVWRLTVGFPCWRCYPDIVFTTEFQ